MYRLILVMLCSGCTSFVPSTLLQVARLDPLTADPADYTVFLTLPPGVDIIPSSATLTFTARKEDDRRRSDQVYVLDQGNDRYAIAPQDHDRMRRQQAMIRAWETTSEIEGDMAIDLQPCVIGEGPADDATLSVDIQISADGPRMPLIRKAPMATLGVDSLPLCPHIPR